MTAKKLHTYSSAMVSDRVDKVTFGFPGPIIFGCGVVNGIAEEVRRLHCERPFVVAGPQVTKAGLLERLLGPIRAFGLEVVVFDDGDLNPTERDVFHGADLFRQSAADMVIAFGGGSRIDLAKAIRFSVSRPGDLGSCYLDSGGVAGYDDSMAPLIAVPTTAGSGSEVSRGAIITDTDQGRKRLIAGPGMMASLAILDPELTVSMSPELTAMTGFDALSHAIETYVGTNFNPIAEGVSRRAAEMIYSHLPDVVRQADDLEGRSQMLIASAMGALGFAKGLGVVHSLAHQLTPECGVPHALAIAIMLPHGMRFNADHAARQYAELGRAMGIADIENDAVATAALVDAITEKRRQLGLPETLAEVGVKREAFDRMAERAMLDHCHRTNPRPCALADMKELYEQAY